MNIDDDLRSSEGLKITEGAYIRSLLEGGAAYDAGLEAGDVIVEVEGRVVKNVTELQEQIGKYRPGNNVEVTVIRNSKKAVYPVTLKDRYGTTNLVKKTETPALKVLGAQFEALDAQEKQRLSVDNGIKIKSLESGALERAGLDPGFVITHIDKQPIHSAKEFAKIIKSKSGGILIEGKHKDGRPDYFAFGIK